MVLRLRRIGRIAGRLAIICTAAGMFGMGIKVIPMLQSMEIEGMEAPPAETIVSDEESVSDAWLGWRLAEGIGAAADTLADTMTQLQAGNANVILWESESSKALWNAKCYPQERTAQDGKVVEKHYGKQSGTQFFSLAQAGQVRNCTFWSNADLKAESEILPDLDLKLDGTPMVLIYHTHTTESFELGERGFFDASFNYRTTEPTRNMVMVGDAIAKSLSDAGIGVVHAGEIHDYPVWNNSYARSAKTIQAVLEKYPSICIALDVHRDAISTNSTVYAPVATIQGKKSAQIMIISGCDNGTLNLPNYRQNFHLASILQQTAESMYEGFTRPILFDYRKYNQDLTNGSLLVEFGSQGNTMEEARYAGELFGNALAETIRNLAARNASNPTQEAQP